jgi:putative acetyltransferase
MNIEPFIVIRQYQEEDAKALVDIYYNTIHRINIKDYTKEQVDAWAPKSSLEMDGWKRKWSQSSPYVATIQGQIVGFAEFEPNGHIDCFYCHHDWIGKGVGSALLNAIENKAHQKGITRIFAVVSITAKPFFASKGFQLVKEQRVLCKEVYLTNFVMEKRLVMP